MQTEILRLRPYISDIKLACEEYQEDPFRLAALVLRESGAGWAKPYWPKGTPTGWGDGATELDPTKGYGFGLFQIDRRWHPGFLALPEAQTVIGQAHYACRILSQARRYLRTRLQPYDLERGTYAAYNAGAGRVATHMKHGPLPRDVDNVTTGRDYSTDVFRRAELLRRAAPELFSKTAPALTNT